MESIKIMPKEEGIEQGLNLVREGYMFIPNRVLSFQSKIFETRLLGETAICMSGEEATRLFYDNSKFTRKDAAPKRALKTLLGEGGVQTLEGQEHLQRKAMFIKAMNPASLNMMRRILVREWEAALDTWIIKGRINIYKESKKMLMRAICRWAGVPVIKNEVKLWSQKMADMYEKPLTVGLEQRQSRKARRQAEAWIKKMIIEVRNNQLRPLKGSVLYEFSWHRDIDGNLLDEQIVAVEVLNILRPTVAVSIYISFLALSLYHYPKEKEKVSSRREKDFEMFVQEVRRFYPFFPFNGARVKEDFIWNGYEFKKDTLTLIDFYGTNHDSEIWESPNIFNPERFSNWDENPYTLIPQGGGHYHTGHRCPGEWMTKDIMKISLDYLANQITYDVPAQDISYSLVSIPTWPKSGFVMDNIRRKR